GPVAAALEQAVPEAEAPEGAVADQGPAAGEAASEEDQAVDAAPVPAEPSTPVPPRQGSGANRGSTHDPHAAQVPRAGQGGTPNAENDMASLLAESDTQLFRQLKYGDVIDGVVMRKDADEVLVDIGFKSEGIIPNNELQSLTATELANLGVGDEVLVSVLQPEDKEGHVVLSLDRARQERSWRNLQKQFENNEIIQAEVNGYNKGGLLVNLEGVRGFVPASQVTGLSSGGTEAAKQSELSRFTGQKMPLKIIEINRNRNRLILSERQAAQEQRDARKEQLLAELTPGQVREGHVSSICDFGAFVDIGGADGLIHLSELSWSRVNHPSEVLKVGQPVNVYVMSVDERDRKIALSLKRTQPEPWSQVMEHYQLGQLVRGTITQLTDFGAFARLEDGIEGLIHVSELAEGRVTHPRNVVQEGWELVLRVIRIDPQRRRMGLSLKRAMEPAEGDTMEPQGPLPLPTPRAAGDGDAGRAAGGPGGRGDRGRRGGRGPQDEGTGAEGQAGESSEPGTMLGGEPAEQPVAVEPTPAPPPAPTPAPAPVAARPVEVRGETAMAQAMYAAQEQAAQNESEPDLDTTAAPSYDADEMSEKTDDATVADLPYLTGTTDTAPNADETAVHTAEVTAADDTSADAGMTSAPAADAGSMSGAADEMPAEETSDMSGAAEEMPTDYSGGGTSDMTAADETGEAGDAVNSTEVESTTAAYGSEMDESAGDAAREGDGTGTAT
ncbi:MAG TPA: 30S ribosomal protein S1, partial [Chloroflexia bacterium]|nr:30S ribosomal protein S1 [Chloroflexia bacterium]